MNLVPVVHDNPLSSFSTTLLLPFHPLSVGSTPVLASLPRSGDRLGLHGVCCFELWQRKVGRVGAGRKAAVGTSCAR